MDYFRTPGESKFNILKIIVVILKSIAFICLFASSFYGEFSVEENILITVFFGFWYGHQFLYISVFGKTILEAGMVRICFFFLNIVVVW